MDRQDKITKGLCSYRECQRKAMRGRTTCSGHMSAGRFLRKGERMTDKQKLRQLDRKIAAGTATRAQVLQAIDLLRDKHAEDARRTAQFAR